MKIIIILLFICSLYGNTLTKEQIKKIKDVYVIGKSIKCKNGMTFGYSLASIMGQESSFGKYIIGDKYSNGKLKSLYDSSLGVFQIKLKTAKLIILKHKDLYNKYKHLIYKGKSIYIKYEKNKKKLLYFKNIIHNKKWIKRAKNNEIKAIKTLNWANKEYIKCLKIHNLLIKKTYKDTLLINKLLSDYKFGAIIAGYYLRDNYEYALKKHMNKAYLRSIGRYNGGWNNFKYAKKIMKRMKLVKKIIKKGY